MKELIKYEAALPFYVKAQQALAKANSVDEVLKIKNTAEAARVYAMQANDDELVNNAVEIKLRAKRRAGEMLTIGKEKGDLKKKHDNQNTGCAKASTSDIGITRHESADWQRLAQVPERQISKAIAVVKERDGVLTEAAVKRELPTHRTNPIPTEKKLPDINQFMSRVCDRLDSLLTLKNDPELIQWLGAISDNADGLHDPAKHSLNHSFAKLRERITFWEGKIR